MADDGRRPVTDRLAARIPFFYGWVMVPLVIVSQVATSPGQTHGVSIFNPSFRGALGLSHTQLTGAYMVGTFLACLPMPFIGAIMDRYGIRRTMAAVALLFGLACIGTSQVTGLMSLFLAFLFLRMLGQGALSLLAGNTLPMWFHARLGTVSGIASVGQTAAVALVPAAFLGLIHLVGWRWAYAILGLLVWSVMLPILALLFRDRPEEIGQGPDGRGRKLAGRSTAEPQRSDVSPVSGDLDFRAALATRAYWILLAAHTSWSLIGTGIVFNIIPLFEDHGLTAADAAATYVTLAMSMAAMQLLGGVLADRVPLHVQIAIGVAGMAIGIGVLTAAESATVAHLYALLFGCAQGLVSVTFHTIWARYFGLTHLGKIRGSVWTATVAGSSVGPFLMGAGYDWLGSYTPILIAFMATFGVLAAASLLARAPKGIGRAV